jgi:outer membrane protein
MPLIGVDMCFARSLIVSSMILFPSLCIAEQGDWLVRVGAHNIDPKSNNHDVVSVDSGTMLTFNGTYMIRPNWGIELLAALPFSHDIDLVGGGKVAETNQLPPTLSVQYHLAPDAAIRPYVGAGVNLTLFYDEQTTGALDGSSLSLGTSVGLALQAGLDVPIGEHWYLNVEVRYIDIDTKAKLDGASLGHVEIDPWLYGLNAGYRF